MQIPDWNATKSSLHSAAQTLSAVRKAAGETQPNHLHHSLFPTPNGLRTGDIPTVGELQLNYRTLQITGNGIAIDLSGNSSQSLFNALQEAVSSHNITLNPPHDLNKTPMTLNSDHAAQFAALMWQMHAAIARFKALCLGGQTPLVVWSHGFDLSTIWFAEGLNEDEDPHMNVGFSPGTSDTPEPYLYFYVSPFQQTVADNLPEIVTWNTNWSTPGGTVVYSQLDAQPDLEQAVVDTLSHVYHIAYRALKN